MADSGAEGEARLGRDVPGTRFDAIGVVTGRQTCSWNYGIRDRGDERFGSPP
jgi:hypothetical protein